VLCTHIWTIRLSDDPQTIVGDAALHDWIKETSTIEIGGTLLPEYHGKGIMISVFDYIISFAKEQLNIKTVIGKTGINNQQAARLVLKLGFTRSNESDGLAVFQKILE
jgi:ribosomal-protein-alanine N-acetyltransferase